MAEVHEVPGTAVELQTEQICKGSLVLYVML